MDNETKLLYQLGSEHYEFALGIGDVYWRQKVSRCYYAAYNVKRAIALCHDGSFTTDSSDHTRIDQLPDQLTNSATYAIKLKALREDRNLADYSHLASASDLVIPVPEAVELVGEFLANAHEFIASKGIDL